MTLKDWLEQLDLRDTSDAPKFASGRNAEDFHEITIVIKGHGCPADAKVVGMSIGMFAVYVRATLGEMQA